MNNVNYNLQQREAEFKRHTERDMMTASSGETRPLFSMYDFNHKNPSYSEWREVPKTAPFYQGYELSYPQTYLNPTRLAPNRVTDGNERFFVAPGWGWGRPGWGWGRPGWGWHHPGWGWRDPLLSQAVYPTSNSYEVKPEDERFFIAPGFGWWGSPWGWGRPGWGWGRPGWGWGRPGWGRPPGGHGGRPPGGPHPR